MQAWNRVFGWLRRSPPPSTPARTIVLNADAPIRQPSDDAFEIDPFAQALARSIAELQDADGFVIGLHGQWGSGKSSAINLIRYHLEAAQRDDLTIIDFRPWWFSGRSDLANAFFSEVARRFRLGWRYRTARTWRAIGRGIVGSAPVVGKAVDVVSLTTLGGVVEGLLTKLGALFGGTESVVELHERLARHLRRRGHRYLVVVDDLDRLHTDEALLILQLLKSVGRLPNVIYLLAYDRPLLEGAVTRTFPTEGPHYLDKVVQAGFDLPLPTAVDVREALARGLHGVIGDLPTDGGTRFWNLFHEGVVPLIRAPRDIVRLLNALRISWPAVREAVDAADFIVLEALRLNRPAVHAALRRHRDKVVGARDSSARSRQTFDEAEILGDLVGADRAQVRATLLRLFPALEGWWGNSSYGPEWLSEWARARRACAPAHFDTYFRFSVGSDAPPPGLVRALVDEADNPDRVTAILRQALATPRRSGGTLAAVLLEALRVHAVDIPGAKVGRLLATLFAFADELNVPADRAQGFGISDNLVRLHWLLNALVRDRVEAEADRDALITEAVQSASLYWLVDLTLRCLGPFEPDRKENVQPLVSKAAAEQLRALALERLSAAAQDGNLEHHGELVLLLARWVGLEGKDDYAPVREWVAARLSKPAVLASLARGFVHETWQQAFGDVVAQRSDYVDVEWVNRFVDFDRFEERVRTFASVPPVDDDARSAMLRFVKASRRTPDAVDRRPHEQADNDVDADDTGL